jgi:hypothetical protein
LLNPPYVLVLGQRPLPRRIALLRQLDFWSRRVAAVVEHVVLTN